MHQVITGGENIVGTLFVYFRVARRTVEQNPRVINLLVVHLRMPVVIRELTMNHD